MAPRTLVAVCVAAAALSTAPAAAGTVGALDHAGRWLTDSSGRVVLLHGVNVTPVAPGMDPIAFGFGEDDASFLREQGLNVVRLGMTPELIEPEFGTFDEGYLDNLERVVEILGEQGIYVVLDLHQDLYSRFVSSAGRGFPQWALQDDGLPHEPDPGFPASYFAEPALNRAFDHFWANDPGPAGRGLQDELGDGWRHVAERFRSHTNVLGYDLLNEPWPGSEWPSCINPVGCPVFDSGPLTAFYRRMVDAIRQVDRSKLIWYEPNPTFNAGFDTHIGSLGDARVGFTFHVYCEFGSLRTDADCQEFIARAFDNAERHSEQTGGPLLVGEFGPIERWTEAEQVLAEADNQLVSWQYWGYWDGTGQPYPCCPQDHDQPPWSVLHDPSQPPAGDNLQEDVVDLIVRPFPHAVAGTPTRVHFDPEARTFELRYSTIGPEGPAPRAATTDVFVPRRVYPSGYELSVQGARRLPRKDDTILQLRANPGAAQVILTLTPRG